MYWFWCGTCSTWLGTWLRTCVSLLVPTRTWAWLAEHWLCPPLVHSGLILRSLYDHNVLWFQTYFFLFLWAESRNEFCDGLLSVQKHVQADVKHVHPVNSTFTNKNQILCRTLTSVSFSVSSGLSTRHWSGSDLFLNKVMDSSDQLMWFYGYH